jgi:hypothetical protein
VGQTRCGNSCVNLDVDDVNCGTCGNICGVFEECLIGVCVCQDGIQSCGGVCTDMRQDDLNCGDCGVVCPAGETCKNGKCKKDKKEK